MNLDKFRSRTALIVTLLVLIAAFAGWSAGRSNSSDTTQKPASIGTKGVSSSELGSLVRYQLPNGWHEGTCSGTSNTIYVLPSGSSLNCALNPSSLIKIYLDPQNITDCNQLKPTNEIDIRKHVCLSLYIDGHKSLKASTQYGSGSSYGQDNTISNYFINTGKGVVAVEYTYNSDNSYQQAFDQLAKSIKIKT